MENMENKDEIVSVCTTWTLAGLMARIKDVKEGDHVLLPNFDVDGIGIDGVDFDPLSVREATAVVLRRGDKVKLCFDDILFDGVISNDGAISDFEQSALGKYLSGTFADAMFDAGIPADDVTLLEKDDVFGEKAYKYFLSATRRVKSLVKNNDYTGWWWLRSQKSSSCFALVSCDGYAYWYYAGNSYGVSPAFEIKNQ